MLISLKAVRRTVPLFAGSLAAILSLSATLQAQAPTVRISAAIDNSQRVLLVGTHPVKARAEFEAGRVPSGTPLQGISMVFSRSAAQEADLQALLAAQQNPVSPLYHQWLTPDQFAARFGVADADIAKVQFWLQQQGFVVDGISRSRDLVNFSGNSGQVEAAFATEMHYYNLGGVKHFAPLVDLSVPAALSSVVLSVTNLSSFRPKSHVKIAVPQRAPQPNFTSSQTGNNFLTPGDIATIYNISPAYAGGYTGSGQSIADVGQSEIVLTDIENFESAAGLPKKDPTLVLVPNSGSAAISTGDESESDLDLEYSSAIAKGATIYFVYVGNNQNYSVFDSLKYAIGNDIAPVITISYGDCESDLSGNGSPSGTYATINAKLAQAAAQGQTVVAANGDSGSTDCYGNTDQSTAEQEALAVDFPSSSQYVTGMGGSEFPAADVAAGNTTYWLAESTADIISSARSYIPEQVWNDDSSSGGLSSGGGGTSILTARPSWQTGVPGIPAGSFRLLPDISLTASPNNAGFLYCSSDTSIGITGSCSHGFRDANNQYLTVAGGTSFDAPIFAGMVAIINQKTDSAGQGVVNSTLYKLASDATTYASAFHDITSGSNECAAGATYCSAAGESEYLATAGYDEASGLGSVNFYELLLAWSGSSSSSPVATATTLSPATSTPGPGANDVVTITVAAATSTTLNAGPTGTLTIVVDGVTQTSSLALSDGVATFTFESSVSGGHTVTATYSGDANYASSTGTVTLTVSSSPKTFTLSATGATVSAGGSVTSTVTVTPQNGYTGTIAWTVTSSPSILNSCFTLPNTMVSGATSATLTIYTSASSCTSGAAIGARGNKRKLSGMVPIFFHGDFPFVASPKLYIFTIVLVLAGLLFVGFAGVRPRRLVALSCALAVGTLFAVLAGCASSGSSSSSANTSTTFAAKGSYTLTITGTDTSNASISASATATLTVD